MGLMSKKGNITKYTKDGKRIRNKSTGRNYAVDLKYERKPLVMKKRANRNKARRTLMAKGLVHKGDGMDVNHTNGNALDNAPSNWDVETASKNRSYPRVKGAHKKFASS